MWIVIVEFITENAVFLGGAAALTTIVEVTFAPFRTFAKRKQKPQQVEIIQADDNPRLDIVSFLQIQKKMRADIKAELEDAHAGERETLLAKIAELDTRIANPDQALQAANEQIAKLETLLEREGNDIGGDRLVKARTALEAGDYSIADEIFAEVEARADLEVQSAARAAFGRGEIAEAEIRWADAASYYSKAARLDPTYDTLLKAGTFLWRSGQHKSAVRIKEDLHELAILQYGDQDVKTATAMNELALNYNTMGDYNAAEQLHRQALAISEKTIGVEHPDYGTSLNNLGEVLRAKGDNVAAEPLYRQALLIDEKTIGVEHPNYALSLNNLGEVLHDKGDISAAESLYRQAMEIAEKSVGVEHPDYAIHLNNLALLLDAKGDYTASEPLYRQALAIAKRTCGVEHPDYATNLNNLAELLRAKGDDTAAEPLFRQALAIAKKTLGVEHPNCAILLSNLAELLRAKGDNTAAEPLFRQALAIDEKNLGVEHPDYAIGLNNLALLLQAKGDFTAAEPLFRQAVSAMEAALGPEHSDSMTACANLESFLRDKP